VKGLEWRWKKISCRVLFAFPAVTPKKTPLQGGVIFKKTNEGLLKT
jgi:hypothetical protein